MWLRDWDKISCPNLNRKWEKNHKLRDAYREKFISKKFISKKRYQLSSMAKHKLLKTANQKKKKNLLKTEHN